MTTFTKGITAAAVLALTGSAMAQITITPGGNGAATTNGQFQHTGLPGTPTSTGGNTSNFRNTTPASGDQLFQNGWGFRGNNDVRNFWIANGVGSGVASTGTAVGNNLGTLNTGGYDGNVSNTTSQYNFDYQMRWQISTDGANANVLSWITITNRAASSLALTLFNYADFDANASAGTDTYAINGSGDQFTISDAGTTVNYKGWGASAYQATAFSTLRTNFSNGSLLNLNNTVAGSPGDFTGAFQWSGLVLEPGASTTVYASFAINRETVPTPGALALMGIAGVAAARRRRA